MHNYTKILLSIFSIILIVSFLLPSLSIINRAYAEEGSSLREEIFDASRLPAVGHQAGYNVEGVKSPTTIIIEVIKIVLGFIGMLFVILMIWSGFQWMTAGGNAEVITKAKGRIINAVIGLLIILSAFAITEFILDRITTAVTS